MPGKRTLIHPLTAPLAETVGPRFWKYVDKSPGQGPNGDCWVWTGGRNANGYGTFGIAARSLLAHRVGYALTFGAFDQSKLGCHRCDNPACVRPDHIFLGTSSDNTQDSANKKRHRGARQTECINGHPYTPENTYTSSVGKRMCRVCIKIRTDEATERERQARKSNLNQQ